MLFGHFMGNYENVQLRAAVFILKMPERSAGASQCGNNDGREERKTQAQIISLSC